MPHRGLHSESTPARRVSLAPGRSSRPEEQDGQNTTTSERPPSGTYTRQRDTKRVASHAVTTYAHTHTHKDSHVHTHTRHEQQCSGSAFDTRCIYFLPVSCRRSRARPEDDAAHSRGPIANKSTCLHYTATARVHPTVNADFTTGVKVPADRENVARRSSQRRSIERVVHYFGVIATTWRPRTGNRFTTS